MRWVGNSKDTRIRSRRRGRERNWVDVANRMNEFRGTVRAHQYRSWCAVKNTNDPLTTWTMNRAKKSIKLSASQALTRMKKRERERKRARVVQWKRGEIGEERLRVVSWERITVGPLTCKIRVVDCANTNRRVWKNVGRRGWRQWYWGRVRDVFVWCWMSDEIIGWVFWGSMCFFHPFLTRGQK